MAVTIKNDDELRRMATAGEVVALVHTRLEEALAPGVSTLELDAIARDTLREVGAKSSFLGYHGYPGHICASINDEIVHGIPGRRRLRDGDIITIDVGAIVGGFHGDSAWTYRVGLISDEAAALLRDTEAALYAAIEAVKPGCRLGAVGHAVEAYARERGRGLVRGYGGHGIGRSMHEEPHVPNHGRPDQGIRLRVGMTFAIEPMLTTGGDKTRELRDGWTVVTRDGSLAAHFEHTVAVKAEGARVLTPRLATVLK